MMMTMIMISGEGDDKDNRELKQLLLLRRRRRQQQLQKTIGLMIKTARAARFSVQFFDVQFKSKKLNQKAIPAHGRAHFSSGTKSALANWTALALI